MRRSGVAVAAMHRHAGPMRHRLEPRGGARDLQADYLEEKEAPAMIYVEQDDRHNEPTIVSYTSIEDFLETTLMSGGRWPKDKWEEIRAEMFGPEGSGEYYDVDDKYRVVTVEGLLLEIEYLKVLIETMETGGGAAVSGPRIFFVRSTKDDYFVGVVMADSEEGARREAWINYTEYYRSDDEWREYHADASELDVVDIGTSYFAGDAEGNLEFPAIAVR